MANILRFVVLLLCRATEGDYGDETLTRESMRTSGSSAIVTLHTELNIAVVKLCCIDVIR